MKVCLLTTGQPATNPRLVKEADALTSAGLEVTVVSSYWVDWACGPDEKLLASRSWSHFRVGGDPREASYRYWFTRFRHRLSRSALRRIWRRGVSHRALSRVTPDLIVAARSIPADLYIGHNLGALPAAVAGAQKHSGCAGFDAEDFYSDMVPLDQRSPDDILAEQVESNYLPYCDFVSAASPEMSRAYAGKYGIPEPTPILNVFPLAQRPLAFRPTDCSGPLKLYWFSQTIGRDRGLEDAIQAMGLIGARDIQLYLQGQWSPGYEESLLACMKDNGVDRRQVIHLPPEYPDAIVRRASTCDIGLALEHSSSRNRDLTLSNKIFTYILAGNAVAATATSGQKPVVERITPAAAAYTPGDAAGLAAILERWYGDRPMLDSARRTAWDWGTREYNWDLEQKKFLRQVSGLSRQPHAVEMLR